MAARNNRNGQPSLVRLVLKWTARRTNFTPKRYSFLRQRFFLWIWYSLLNFEVYILLFKTSKVYPKMIHRSQVKRLQNWEFLMSKSFLTRVFISFLFSRRAEIKSCTQHGKQILWCSSGYKISSFLCPRHDLLKKFLISSKNANYTSHRTQIRTKLC